MDAVLDAIEDSHNTAIVNHNSSGISNGNSSGNSSGSSESNSGVSKLCDNCNKLLFSDLCKNFELIEKTSGSARKFGIIFNKALLNHLAGQSVFPLMRLVLPSIDTERGKYGLKQTSIARAFVSALHLDATRSEDAKRLLNWKDPTKAGGDGAKMVFGDFGTHLQKVLESRVRSAFSNKTIGEVNAILDELAAADDNGKKLDIIRGLILNQFCAIEQKWLMRIVFQDLKVGLRHDSVFNQFSPTALQRYNECTNLRTVCEEETAGTKMSGIRPFFEFNPMLAARKLDAKTGPEQLKFAINAMRGQPFAMDVKLDGERMMIHINKGEMMMFTRNGSDYTDAYRSLGETVMQCVSCDACILDGEVCAFDNHTKSFIRFGRNKGVGKEERDTLSSSSSNGRHSTHPWELLDEWLVFIVFDIVYLDGDGTQDLISNTCSSFKYEGPQGSGEITQLPLIVRRELLKKVVRFIDNRVEFIAHQIVTSGDPLKRMQIMEEYYNKAIDAGEEGLVVKNLASCYELGIQSKALELWIKLKPDYGDGIEELDLVILGAYYGEGLSMRGQGLSTFLLGVRNDLRDQNGGDEYLTLCKVGTGYSFAELEELRKKLADAAVRWDSMHPPAHLSRLRFNKPDVYIPVDQSVVVELKCGEITDSNQFSANMTCRFPRVTRIRYDKPVTDILTMSELPAVRSRPRRVLDQSSLASQDPIAAANAKSSGFYGRGRSAGGRVTSQALPKRKLGATTANTVDEMFRVSTETVEVKNSLFKGKAFCFLGDEYVYSDEKTFTKSELITAVRAHGGAVVGSVCPLVIAVAGSKRTYQIKEHIKKGEVDVIDFKFIVDCLLAGYLLPLTHRCYLGCSHQTEEKFLGLIDSCGDHYTEEINSRELQEIISHLRTVLPAPGNSSSLSSSQATEDNNVSNLEPVGSYGYSYKLKRREHQAMVHEYASMHGVGWRAIMDVVDVDERTLVCGDQNALWNPDVILYIDCGPLGSLDLIPASSCGVINVNLSALATRLKLRGCNVSDTLTVYVTHVVISKHHIERIPVVQAEITRLHSGLDSNVLLVEDTWAEQCISSNRLLIPITSEYVLVA